MLTQTLLIFLDYTLESQYIDRFCTRYSVPERFVCSNKNVAKELHEILKCIEYHDRVNKKILRGKNRRKICRCSARRILKVKIDTDRY